jgi:hypothetical protein
MTRKHIAITAGVALGLLGMALLMGSGGIQSAYNLIENAGSPLTRRTILNFTGSGVSCADANPITTCTVSGASSSGGIVTFSGGITGSTGVTVYVPVGATGPQPSTGSATEDYVQIPIASAATASNMYVSVSTAPGTGNSLAFTWRDNGANTSLTCTISGSSETTCSDTTDTATIGAGDLVDISMVPSGTLATTFLTGISTLLGVSASANPFFSISNASSTGTTVNTLTKLTGAPSTAVITATSDTGGAIGITTAGAGSSGTATITTAGKISCIFDGATTAGDYVQISSTTAGNCHDTGSGSYPSTGQVLGRVLSTNGSGGTYTLDLFPSEIKAASGGSGSFSAAPPYYYDGTHYYVTGTGYEATKPSSTPTWINSVTPTVTTGTNGDLVFSGTGSYFSEVSMTSSVEAEFSFQDAQTNSNSGSSAFLWIWDSTNSLIWTFESSDNKELPAILLNEWNYSGTGNPSFTFNPFTAYAPNCGTSACHFRISISGGTATFAVSLNGGVTFTTIITESVGTVNEGGYGEYGNGSTIVTDLYSFVAN